jgi:hypothetical protein
MPRQISIYPDPFAFMEKGRDQSVVYQFVEARFQGQGAGVVDTAYQYHHCHPPLLSSSDLCPVSDLQPQTVPVHGNGFSCPCKFRKALSVRIPVVC